MVTADQVTDCAQILMATTGNWKSSDGDISKLADARLMLAQTIYASAGNGFPAPAADGAMKQPASRDAWKACVVAAQAALDENGDPRDPLGPYVVFWAADPNNSAKVGSDLALNWPLRPDSHMIRVSGAIDEGDDPVPKRLFFFDKIDESAAIEMDADAGPGFWPRAAKVPGRTAAAATGQRSLAAAPVASRTKLATWLFVLWAIVGSYVAVWSWFITLFATGNKPEQPWLETLFWTPLTFASTENHYSLLLPYLITMGSIALLIVAAGLAQNGLWFGALVDGRNRFSLSQTQQFAWTILLLGSLGVMGWFNATAGSGNTSNLFPEMSAALWAALGINLALSPLISDTVLEMKDRSIVVSSAAPSTATTTRSLIQPAELDRNQSPREASWTDLITGETVGTQDQLDPSRLQHVVISGMLFTTYFLEVLKKLVELPVKSPLVPFDKMPPAGTTFISLLAFSHAGYLIFKARKKDDKGNDQPSAT